MDRTTSAGPHLALHAGLRIAKGSAPITRTWILYNKPKVPQYTHAGVLMGLGLAGPAQSPHACTRLTALLLHLMPGLTKLAKGVHVCEVVCT